jgi:hypothetical protein
VHDLFLVIILLEADPRSTDVPLRSLFEPMNIQVFWPDYTADLLEKSVKLS